MKLYLLNVDGALRPLYEEDSETKKRLKRNTVYLADIKESRNYEFHKKFFALIHCSFEYLPEKQRQGFHENPDNWRKYVTVLAGHVDMFYSPEYKIWLQIPKSISFESMSESEFQEFYDRACDEIFKIIGPYVSEDDFYENLANF